MGVSSMSLSLQSLPVFYQLLLSEIDSVQLEKINTRIAHYNVVAMDKGDQYFYLHPSKKGKFTAIQALAFTLLELRSEDTEFRSKAITRYLSFKFALQLDLINEWRSQQVVLDYEQDFYVYFNALSLMDEKKYQQAINTIETIITNYDITDPKLSTSRLLFLIDCYNLYVLCYILLNDFKKAHFELSQLLFLVEKKSKDREIYFSLYYLAKHKELFLSILQEDTTKIHQLIRGFNTAKNQIKDFYTLGMFTGLLALYYLKEHDYDKVEELLQESGDIFKQFGSERLVTDIYFNLLAFKLQQGDIYGAISVYEVNKTIFANPEDLVSSLKFAILFGDIYFSTNQITESEQEIHWLVANADQLYRIREIDYWLLLHSLAERHDRDELRNITDTKLGSLFANSNLDEKTVYVYNVRKESLIYYARGDFDQAGKRLVSEKDTLVNMDIIDYHFDINLDLMRNYLKQYEFSKSKETLNKIKAIFNDLEVFVKSSKSKEALIFLSKSKIYFLLSTNDYLHADKEITSLLSILSDEKKNNSFLESLFNQINKLQTNIERFKHNKFYFLVSELNKYDLTESIPTFDIFVAVNQATIEEIWRNMCIRNALIGISVIRIQRLNKFDLRRLNVNRIPGLMRSFD